MVKKIKKKRAAARQRLIDRNNPFRAVTARASSQTPYAPPSKPQEKVDNNPYKSVTTYTPSQISYTPTTQSFTSTSTSRQIVYPLSKPQEKVNKMFKGYDVKHCLKKLQAMNDALEKMKDSNASAQMPVSVDQSSTITYSKGLTYSVNSDGKTCTITGIGTCTDEDLKIPSVIDGYKVTAIGDKAFEYCIYTPSLTNVIIPDSVEKIGQQAFRSCTRLVSVTVGNGTTTIGIRAFIGCSSLTSITVGSNVSCIDFYAFEETRKLTDVYYRGSQSNWQAIDIRSGNQQLTKVTIHYNS